VRTTAIHGSLPTALIGLAYLDFLVDQLVVVDDTLRLGADQTGINLLEYSEN